MSADISVIIPVYNVSEYIEQCFDSIIIQSLENIEIIIIDDGSTDGCLDIIKKYASSDPRFVVIEQKNQGPGVARNRGIERSTGKYIVFMDPDDWYPSAETLKNLIEKIEKSRCEIAGGSLCFYDEKKQNLVPNEVPKAVFHEEGIMEYMDYQYDYFYMRFIYSARFLKENKLFFPNLRRFQDVIFFLNVMSKCKKFYAFPETVYVYRGNNHAASFFSKEKSLAWMEGIRQGLEISHKNNWAQIHYDTLKILTYDNFLEATEPLRESFDEDYEKSMRNILSVVDNRLLSIQDYNIDTDFQAYGVLNHAYLWSINYIKNDRKSEYIKSLIEHIGPLEFIRTLVYNYFRNKPDLVKITDLMPHEQIKKKIKTIGIYNETMNVGGVERCISIFIPMFIRMGYKIVLLSDTPADEDKFPIPSYVKRIVLPGCTPAQREDWMRRMGALSAAIKENGIDLLYYHSYWKSEIIFDELVCKFVCKIPFLLHHHNVFSAMLARGNNIFDDAISLYSFSDLLISLSTIDQLYFRLNGLPSVYVPNPVGDFERHEYTRNEKTLLWVGRFVPNHKQPIEMLKILCEVVKQIPDVKLYMIGDGTDDVKNSLYQYVTDHALTDNVVFTGFISNVEDYYKTSKVMVLTSCIEGFPMVVAECKSYSLPMVSYDLPYVEMIRDPDSGVIRVPQGNSSVAASEICKLLTDEKYYEKISSESFDGLSKYSDENLIKSWKKVLSYLQGNSKADFISPKANIEDFRILSETLKYHIQLSRKKYDTDVKSEKELRFVYGGSFKEIPREFLNTSSTLETKDYSNKTITFTEKGKILSRNGWRDYYALPKTRTDAVVSIGKGMKAKYNIETNIHSEYIMPFSTFADYPLNSLLGAFRRGVDDLFLNYKEESKENISIVTDTDRMLVDTRDFQADCDTTSTIKKIIERESRDLHKMQSLLQSVSTCVLIAINRNNNSQIVEFTKKLHSFYPSSEIETLIITNYPELGKEILYRNVFQSPGITVRNIAMNDKGPESWKGNTTMWRSLLSRYLENNDHYNKTNDEEYIESLDYIRLKAKENIKGMKSILLDLLIDNYSQDYKKEIEDVALSICDSQECRKLLEISDKFINGEKSIDKDVELGLRILGHYIHVVGGSEYYLKKYEKLDQDSYHKLLNILVESEDPYASFIRSIEIEKTDSKESEKLLSKASSVPKAREKLFIRLIDQKRNIEAYNLAMSSEDEFLQGMCLFEGIGIPADKNKGKELMNSASAGHPDLLRRLMDVYYKSGDYQDCLRICSLLPDDKDSLFRQAQMYRNGNGVRKDLEMAKELFLSAAEKGHPAAAAEAEKTDNALDTQSGRRKLKDIYGDPSRVKEFSSLMKELGDDPVGKAYLSRAYRTGYGVAKDLHRAIEIMQGIAGDNIGYNCELFDMLAEAGRYDEAAESIDRLKGSDDTGVRKRMSLSDEWTWNSGREAKEYLKEHFGNSEFKTECIEMIKDLCKKDDPTGKAYLSRAYRTGYGVRRNPKKAAEIMKDICGDNAGYICELCDTYLEAGRKDEAYILMALHRNSADQRIKDRYSRMDRKEMLDVLERKDPETYVSVLGEEGTPDSLCRLGRHFQGKDDRKAYTFLKKASDLGDAGASKLLLKMLWSGGKPGNDRECFLLSERLHALGDREGTAYLARCHHLGKGTGKDVVLAAKLMGSVAGDNIGYNCELFDMLMEIGTAASQREAKKIISGFLDSDDARVRKRVSEIRKTGRD